MEDYERINIVSEESKLYLPPDTQAYKKDDVRIIVSKQTGHDSLDFCPANDNRQTLHMSISCADRNPTWEEIREARYRFMPSNRDAIMVLPQKKNYVNVHNYCFHLWMFLE